MSRGARRLSGPFPFDLRAISVVEGLRAAFASAVLVVLAELFGYPALTWSAIAAFWGCLADPGGALGTRLLSMMVLTLGGALVSALATQVSGSLPEIVLATAFAVSFSGTMLRIYSGKLALTGQLITIAFLVSLGDPAASPHAGLEHGVLFLLGGVWAMTMTLVLWRVSPGRPAREAVASVYDRLAEFAEAIRRLIVTRDDDADAWAELGLKHRRQIRQSIEAAQSMMRDSRLLRYGPSRRGEQRLLLLQTADKIFADLIALESLLTLPPTGQDERRPSRTLVGLKLRRLHLILHGLATAVQAELPRSTSGLVDAIDAFKALTDKESPGVQATIQGRHLFSDLAECLARGLAILEGKTTAETTGPNQATIPGLPLPWRQRLLGPLRANASIHSLDARHALRVALTVTIGVWVTNHWPISHGYWLTLTIALVMQPHFGTTWVRAAERVAGSVIGSGVAILITTLLHDPLWLAIALFPLTAATMALRTVSHTLYIAFLTPQFVLVTGLGEPGGSEMMLALLRILDTLLGGLLALIGSLVFWPAWEPEHLRHHISDALRATAAYLRGIIATRQEEISPIVLERKRRAMGLASINAEASLQRVTLEPTPDLTRHEAATAVIISLRKLGAAAVSLALLPEEAWDGCDPAFAALADLARQLDELAGTDSPSTANDPAAPSKSANIVVDQMLQAMTFQLGLIHDSLLRLEPR